MKFCFRPFGVGFEDMETDEIKQKGVEAYKAAKEHAKHGAFIALGLALLAGEVLTRHAANGLTHAANKVADCHDRIVEKQSEIDLTYTKDNGFSVSGSLAQ